MYTRRLTVLATLAAAGLTLTACGSGPSSSDAEELSPLNEYLAAAWGGDLSEEEQTARFDEENQRREEIIAQCMTEQGFEYIPATGGSSISFGSDIDWRPDDRDWVEQWGYGAVTGPWEEAAEPEPEEWVDPNDDYVTSLSEAEQTAYYEALHGPQPTEEEMAAMEDGTWEWNWETSGCYGYADHEVQGEDVMTAEEHQPLMDAINDFYINMFSAPELAEINAAWAACMDENGYPGFTDQADAQNVIHEELNAYYDSQTEWVENDPALEELREREVAQALVDLECREKTDYTSSTQEIIFAMEEQFIADHKAELDAFKAAAEQGR